MLVSWVAALLSEVDQSWIPLPYEMASAVVRTLVLHSKKLQDGRQDLARLAERDPAHQQAKTKAACETVKKLEEARRFIVMNRRTGQVASGDWLQKHVRVDATSNQPIPTNPKEKLWVMTLGFKLRGPDQVELTLSLESGQAPLPLRCYRLIGLEASNLPALLEGYAHVLENEPDVQAMLVCLCCTL